MQFETVDLPHANPPRGINRGYLEIDASFNRVSAGTHS